MAKFKSLWKLFNGYLVFVIIYSILWQFCNAIGQLFIASLCLNIKQIILPSGHTAGRRHAQTGSANMNDRGRQIEQKRVEVNRSRKRHLLDIPIERLKHPLEWGLKGETERERKKGK